MREVQDFLVRIFDTVRDVPLGCGFLVDKDKRHILTCCHVVNAALRRDEDSQPSDSVFLDFPFLASNHLIKAEVERWHYATDDPLRDICVLKLLDDVPSNAQPAPVVRANDYSDDGFRAFGFPADFEDNGREVKGVLGAKQVNGRVLAEGVSQFGYFIEGGFSGTPIWNITRGGVCGMAFQVDTPAAVKVASIIPTEQLMQSASDLIELSGAIPSYLRRLIADLESRRGVLQYVDLSGQAEVSTESRTSSFDIDDEFGFSELVQKHQLPQTIHLGKIRDVLDKHQRFVLIGEAGSSKTTTVRRLTLEAAHRRLIDETAPLPLLLYLPQWESELTPEEFVCGQWKAEELSEHGDLMQLLKSGAVRLYLDGLNEMGKRSGESAKKLKDWLASSTSATYVIVTCRKDSYVGDLELGLPVIQIEPMSDEHIQQFVQNYLPAKAENFLKRIFPSSSEMREDKRQLYQLIRNPYMLSALIVVFLDSSDDNLPQNSGKLFSKLVRALAAREVRRHTQSWANLDERFSVVEDALARLSFAMLDENKGSEVSITYARQFLDDDTLQAAQDASFIEFVDGNVRFFHQLMQEYFAAIKLRTLKTAPAYPRSLKTAFSEFIGIKRPTKLEAVAENPYLFQSNGSVWEQVIISLCGIEDDANATIQQICEVNPYLAVQCFKSIGAPSLTTDRKIVEALKLFLGGNGYHHALHLLGDHATDLATETIIEFLEANPNDSVRREHAVQELGRCNNSLALRPLLQSLADEDGEVRWFAALSLANIPDMPIDELVHKFLSSEIRSELHISYATALEKLGKRAVPVLTQFIVESDSISDQRELGTILVKLMPTNEAIPALMKIMSDKEEIWRSNRQDAVDHLAELEAVNELVELLSSLDDWAMQMRIAGKLVGMGTSEAIDAVEKWRPGIVQKVFTKHPDDG